MIGELNERASLLAPLLTPDGGGGFSESWSAVADLWIAVVPSSGVDTFGPDRLESRARYRVALRRRDDVAAGMRLQSLSHRLAILAVLPEGPRAQFTTLLCEDAP